MLGGPKNEYHMLENATFKVIGRYLPLTSPLDPFDLSNWKKGKNGEICFTNESIEFSQFVIPQTSIHRATICSYTGGYDRHKVLRLTTEDGHYDFLFSRGQEIKQYIRIPVHLENRERKRTKKEKVWLAITIFILILFSVLLLLYYLNK
jgi:hypothetical protein